MMDVLEYSKQAIRMCKYYNGDRHNSKEHDCQHNGEVCPLHAGPCNILYFDITPKEAENIALTVKNWALEHPIKTMKDHILESFPNAKIDKDGYPYMMVPCHIDNFERCGGRDCYHCRKDFFEKEYKE